MEKKTATKPKKEVKKILQPKKPPKSPEFIDSSKEDEEPPLLGVKEEVQGLFDLWKENKKFDIQEKGGGGSFLGRGHYEGHELSMLPYMILNTSGGLLKMPGLEKKTKDLIKQALTKT